MKALLHCISERSANSKGFRDTVGTKNVLNFIPDSAGHIDFSTDKKCSLDEVDLDEFDVIAFSDKSFLDKNQETILNHKTSAKRIMLDWGDDFFIRGIYKSQNLDHYFKRELYRDSDTLYKVGWSLRYLYGIYLHNLSTENAFTRLNMPIDIAISSRMRNVHPYPLICETERLPKVKKTERTYNMSFIMRLEMITMRHSIYKFLTENQDNQMPKVFISTGGLSTEKYSSIVNNSKAALSIRGYGFDTLRYWEIPYFKTLLFSQRLPLILPNDFVDMESALFFDDIGEMTTKFKKYVLDSNEWEEIAKNGYENYKKYHTPKKRVELNILKRIKG